MNNPLDLEPIKQDMAAWDATTTEDGPHAGFRLAAHVPDLVAEVERLHAVSADLVALVQPILDRTKDQIGTHSDRCFEYHVACLAGLVSARLAVPSSLNSQEAPNGD